MRKRTGFFVTIEGIEGAGKSTLAEKLAAHLQARGCEVIVTMEPGGCELGVRVRELVLDSTSAISDRAELLLFEAARAQHVDETIRPALSRGAVVICDRFADSSLAYQGYARGIDLNRVKALNDYATSGLKPDLTILLDLPADEGLSRQKKTDRVSSKGLEFHEAVRQGFLALAQAEPDRFVILDARQGIDEIVRQSLGVVEKVLGQVPFPNS